MISRAYVHLLQNGWFLQTERVSTNRLARNGHVIKCTPYRQGHVVIVVNQPDRGSEKSNIVPGATEDKLLVVPDTRRLAALPYRITVDAPLLLLPTSRGKTRVPCGRSLVCWVIASRVVGGPESSQRRNWSRRVVVVVTVFGRFRRLVRRLSRRRCGRRASEPGSADRRCASSPSTTTRTLTVMVAWLVSEGVTQVSMARQTPAHLRTRSPRSQGHHRTAVA
jgi:hypothetical protein